jgi:hypothetical protein
MKKNYNQGNLQAIQWWFCFKWDHIPVEWDPITMNYELTYPMENKEE